MGGLDLLKELVWMDRKTILSCGHTDTILRMVADSLKSFGDLIFREGLTANRTPPVSDTRPS